MQSWKAGSQAMVSVNAIFAGFSGAMVAGVIAVAEKSGWLEASMLLSLVSLVLFALAAERITDALDEGDVSIYLQSALMYNIAVVLLFSALGLFLVARGYCRVAVIPALGSFYPWAKDIYWLLFAPKAEKDAYIEELNKES